MIGGGDWRSSVFGEDGDLRMDQRQLVRLQVQSAELRRKKRTKGGGS